MFFFSQDVVLTNALKFPTNKKTQVVKISGGLNPPIPHFGTLFRRLLRT